MIVKFGHRTQLTPQLREQVYNGMDCVVTHHVAGELEGKLGAGERLVYDFDRSMLGPAMTMMMRGIRIDQRERKRLLKETLAAIETKRAELDKLATERWGKGLNPRSNPTLQEFFFKVLHARSGKRKPSVDKEFLDRTLNDPKVGPFSRLVKDVRTLYEQGEIMGLRSEKGKHVEVEITDADGRVRSSFNVGQTETGRWSTSDSPLKTGISMHGVTKPMRGAFVADPGCELFYADLAQVQSKTVAYLAGDEDYIKAHEGDTHTMVAKIAWPDLPWPGSDELIDCPETGKRMPADRCFAESTFMDWDVTLPIRHHAKKLQHGSNFLLTSIGFAKWAHVPQLEAGRMQDRYFAWFPGISRWHGELRAELRATGRLVSPWGAPRDFLGRGWENETLKEAAAHLPQNIEGYILNRGLAQVWWELDEGGAPGEIRPGHVQVLSQNHDAILGQRRIGDEAALRAVKELMRVPVEIRGRTMVVRVDAKVGSNWKACS